MKIFKLGFFLVMILVFSPLVLGAKGEISLVTVGESVDGLIVGGTADAYLEVKLGSGRVFIDSFPFMREDTQVSVRFAKDVACNFLDVDCSRLDFFYTINIGSTSVGGPSAGAAIAVLTISVLSNEALDSDVVVTGTINSGGIIGPVSGLEQKALAAKNAGFSKILVPTRSILLDKTLETFNETADSENLSDSNVTVFYADSLIVEGIEIIPVSTLEEVLFEFTGKTYPDYCYDIVVVDQYQEIMGEVSAQLCSRSEEILNRIPDNIKEENKESLNRAKNSIELGVNATESEDFYSAASFCFTANSALRTLEYKAYSNESLEKIALDIRENVDSLLSEINSRKLRTISDLETYMIVKERLLEARSLLDEDDYLENLGYIMERRYSAIAWSSFFRFEGKEVVLDDKHLKGACIAKISEAEERLSYIDFLTGMIFDRDDLNNAKASLEENDYAFCVFRAAKAKADANAIILSMSLTPERFEDLIDDQLTFARMQINKQGENFPILGYSYYNYANTLKDSRPRLSILFAEYASEFSNLDMYFPSDREIPGFLIYSTFREWLLGMLLGFTTCMILLSVFHLFSRKKRPKSRRAKYVKKNRS